MTYTIDRITPEEIAEWQLELEEDWYGQPLDDVDPLIAIAVRAAREYTMRTLEGAFVYLSKIEPHAPVDWTAEHDYRMPYNWTIQPHDVLYSTLDGWYDQPPAQLAHEGRRETHEHGPQDTRENGGTREAGTEPHGGTCNPSPKAQRHAARLPQRGRMEMENPRRD